MTFLIRDGKGSSINDMKDMLASLPEFQETRDKVSDTAVSFANRRD